jgi:outer membrane lipoprotein-sorting protein
MKRANVILCLVLSLAAGAYLKSWADEKADEIMQKHYALPEAEDMQSTTYMVLREKDGRKTIRQLRMLSQKKASGTNTLVEFLSPADVRGTKFLTLGKKKGDDDQRLWLPDLGKVRKIAASGKSGKFMGSDFTYYDMENRDISDAAYTLLGAEKCTYTKDGKKEARDCWQIESIPTDRDAPYSKVIMWVSKDDYFVYKLEMYAKPKNNIVKRIFILEVQTTSGIIVPVRTVAANVNGHKTLIKVEDVKVNQGLASSLFTVKNLQK